MAFPSEHPHLGDEGRLIGAAIGLGAGSVGPLSEAETRLPASAIRPRPRDLRALREAIRDGRDPLGEAFCELRAAEVRRRDGAIYTPAPIVRAMTEWAAAGPAPQVIVDPGSGSARFAISVAERFPRARILAVELDPLAALISRANLAARGLRGRAQVLVQDYRVFAPPADAGRVLYVGNPPYVRHHQIGPEWKRWLTETALGVGLRASQLAGLHVHFFLATAVHARRGDRGAFVTSSEWLDVNYGALVRDLLLDRLGGLAIHVIAPEVEPFEDVQTTGAITCFEIAAQPTTLRLRRVRRVTELGRLDKGQPVRRERLAEAGRWTPLLRAARGVPDGHVELGELCRVHRGAVTGANRFWVVDAERAEAALPSRFVFRSVTRARELFAAGRSLATAERLKAVIDLPADLDELESDERRAIERFLRAAKRLGVHEGYIARHRRAWWSIGLRRPAPILATYMARRVPAIVRNLADARHINIAHGIYPREDLDEPAVERIAEALRASIHLGAGRTYAGGLTKFEPREMERLLVPDVTQPVA